MSERNLSPPEERRVFARVSFEGQALVRTERHASFVPCEPRNLSLGGVCLRLDEDVELRSEVDVQIVLAHQAQPIQCHGRVNWVTARLDVREQPPIPYDVGIEFIGLSSQLRTELQRVLSQWRQATSPSVPVMTAVVMRLGAVTIRAQLNATATAAALLKALPVTTTAHRWGDELYCAVPVIGVPESPTLDVRVGDVGFWLEGQSLCLFFGRTPASLDDQPRPAAPVNVIGTFTLDERIRAIHDGVPMQITQATDEHA